MSRLACVINNGRERGHSQKVVRSHKVVSWVELRSTVCRDKKYICGPSAEPKTLGYAAINKAVYAGYIEGDCLTSRELAERDLKTRSPEDNNSSSIGASPRRRRD
jgi:hypothetical protein